MIHILYMRTNDNLTDEDMNSLKLNGEPCYIIYPFTNENLKLYNHLDFTKVLIPATDHFFLSLLNGSTDITVYDMNGMTKLWLEFKIAAISTLSFEEFTELFTYILPENKIKDKSYKLNNYLNRIRTVLKTTLNNQEYTIIDKWMENFKNKDSLKNYFSQCYEDYNYIFSNKDNYERLKEIINGEDIYVIFLRTNIIDLASRLDDLDLNSYTCVITSNIIDYVNKYVFIDNVIKPLKKYLADNGQIQIEYIHLFTSIPVFEDLDGIYYKYLEDEDYNKPTNPTSYNNNPYMIIIRKDYIRSSEKKIN